MHIFKMTYKTVFYLGVLLIPLSFFPAFANKGINTINLHYVKLKCENVLTVRTGPAKESPNLNNVDCRLSDGRENAVIILGEKDGYYRVFIDGRSGWISKEFAHTPQEFKKDTKRPADDVAPVKDQGKEPKVKADYHIGQLTCRTNLRMRKGPSTNYRIKGRIPCRDGKSEGTKVQILGRSKSTGWYLVNFGGEKGWVSNRWVDAGEKGGQLRAVVDDAIRTVDKPEKLGVPPIKCYDNLGDCKSYNAKIYTDPDSGKKFSKAIKEASRENVKKMKERFFEIYAPLALHLQRNTGWPASVALAQIALETNWGRSGIHRKINNTSGHSCFTRKERTTRTIRNKFLKAQIKKNPSVVAGAVKPITDKVKLSAACVYPRPRNEKGYYLTFQSIADSFYAYADNVLEARYYRQSQKHVEEAFSKGNVANANDVIKGLRSYALDSKYRSKLKDTIRANGLGRFDKMLSCQ